MWNQYESVLQKFSRTNNLAEGWHNRFHVVVGRNHPSVYAFLVEIQKEQADTEAMIRELELGQKIKKGTSHLRVKKEKNLLTIVQKYNEYYDNDEILQYLKAIGYYVHF